MQNNWRVESAQNVTAGCDLICRALRTLCVHLTSMTREPLSASNPDFRWQNELARAATNMQACYLTNPITIYAQPYRR